MNIVHWFSGGDHQYHNLIHCLQNDWITIYSIVFLCIGVMLSYILIALEWRKDAAQLSSSTAKSALTKLKNIFLWCCFTGYGFVIVKIFWPAWRLEVIALGILNVYSWRYIFFGGLSSVYTHMQKADSLETDVAKLREFANMIPNLAWTAQPDGWVDWYNFQWMIYTGLTIAELRGTGWQKAHDPSELPRVIEKWNAALVDKYPFDIVFPLKSRTGEFRWFLCRARPMTDAFGNVTRWFGTMTDIDHHHKHELELEALIIKHKIERFPNANN